MLTDEVEPMTLDCLSPGQSARVVCLTQGCTMRERLQDLGLLPGKEVAALMRSPLGDPTAYLICDAVIALRREDAAGVTICL